MKSMFVRSACAMTLVFVATGAPIRAQQDTPPAAVRLPVTGSFQGGGSFAGMVTINRFEQTANNQIVAVGFVSGVLSRGSQALGTATAGEVRWSVAVRSGGQLLSIQGAPKGNGITRIAWSPPASTGRYVLVQATSCPVLDVALGPVTVNLLGANVALSAVTLNVSGTQGTPLGDLVCAASDLLGNVAGLVNLLNGILGLLTGLLGGLTGGLGGVVP
jgi:hypothetical protein